MSHLEKERHIPEISVIWTFSTDGEGEFGSRRPFPRAGMGAGSLRPEIKKTALRKCEGWCLVPGR